MPRIDNLRHPRPGDQHCDLPPPEHVGQIAYVNNNTDKNVCVDGWAWVGARNREPFIAREFDDGLDWSRVSKARDVEGVTIQIGGEW
jgi:hypothetical protein